MEAGWLTIKISCPASCSICNELPGKCTLNTSHAGYSVLHWFPEVPALPALLWSLTSRPPNSSSVFLWLAAQTYHSFQPPLASCQCFVSPIGQGGILNNLHCKYLILSWKGESGEPWSIAQWGGGLDGESFGSKRTWAWILASPIGEVVFNLASYFNSLSLSFLHCKMMRKIPIS